MGSIFENMPNFAAFRNQQGNNAGPPSNNDSIYSNRTPFSNPVNYNTPSMPDPSQSNQGGNGTGDSGFFGNAWNGIMNGGKSVLDFVGHKFDQFENATGLNHIAGAMKGITDPQQTYSNPWANDGSYLGAYKNAAGAAITAAKNIGQSAFNGFMNPDATKDRFNTDLQSITQNMNPAARVGFSFLSNAGTDPLSYVPLGAIGKGISKASDAAGLTPYLQSAVDAVKASKVVQNPVVQGTKDALGKAFVKNYGVSNDLSDILKRGSGEQSLHDVNNLSGIREFQQTHGLTPDQLNEIGHVTEKTIPGTPEQQALAQQLKSLMENGSQGSGVGSNLMSNTASAVTGEPLLHAKIDDYFPHIYKNVPDELKGVFPTKQEGVGGLSANGTYNLPRTFGTLQDAMNKGLKPELNPFAATGERLGQMSKAYVNNNIIKEIKSTPGILFDKDPIDEVSKLVKTGRMTADQAAAHLGMTVEDMKKGFVQSKVPQLRGAYIRPGDDAALIEHLQPSQPTGLLGGVNKLNNLYNKGFLLNPLPHLHNVLTNGVGLGEANPSYIKEARDMLQAGKSDPWYQQAVKSGAINNPVEGSLTNAIKNNREGNLLSQTVNSTKDALSTKPTSVSDLVGKLKAPFEPTLHASHDLLWNTDKAIRTALFRQGIEKGLSESEAAAQTNKFMVDYNNITPFERKYIKPIVPFYAWKKGNIPLQVSQTFAQTPKYIAAQHLKDAVSEEVSGQPTDAKGRIQTNEQLSDGSKVAIDPYIPMDEPEKIMEKGVIPWAINSINPIMREGIAQGTSALGAFNPKFGVNSQYPIYNAAAPAEYNARKGVAHLINGLNPFSGSAILGQTVGDTSGLVNKALGLNSKDKPGQTASETITKLLGGFSGHNNPVKDAKNAQYDKKDNAAGQIKYLKETGQPVPKSLKRDAYRKVK